VSVFVSAYCYFTTPTTTSRSTTAIITTTTAFTMLLGQLRHDKSPESCALLSPPAEKHPEHPAPTAHRPRSFGDPKCLFHRHGFPAQAHILVRPLLPSSFRRLKSTTNTDHHPDSIVPMIARAPVFKGPAYRDTDQTHGGPIDGHMVTSPFVHRGNGPPEWVRVLLLLQR